MKLEARILKLVGGDKLKAYASVCVEDKLLIKGIKIIDGVNGRFASMPSRKTRQGEYADICFPITPDMREEIEKAVLDAYSKKLEEL